MNRCLQLARLGAGHVAPNPMVGAVLVHGDMIIGEGYHQRFGEAHAEVNCFNSVSPENQSLINKSTLYVSLEPCAHYGKTPPCADLIIQYRVPHVVIGCSDSFAEVSGKGMAKLRDAGIEVTENILKEEALELNKRFFTFHASKRPWILLKWAQTSDGYIAGENFEQLTISNAYTNRFTHQLRDTQTAVMVGFRTAWHDNPSLTSRYGYKNHPVRIVLDTLLKLPASGAVFADTAPVIVLNRLQEKQAAHIHYAKVPEGGDTLHFLMELLYKKKLSSLLVEGGSFLLQSFIDAGLWDEALVITNQSFLQKNGIKAPFLHHERLIQQLSIETDLLCTYKNSIS